MIRRVRALASDAFMCAAINLVQMRHRLPADARDRMRHYVEECEQKTLDEYYRPSSPACFPHNGGAKAFLTWPSPIMTAFASNNVARVDLFPAERGWKAGTVLMLHALMSATSRGYRRWAAHFNARGWNACFVHLPFHYSRVPPGHWNGELAITADLIRNAEGLRQGVMELRQLLGYLREQGAGSVAILGTSYGAWIAALLACVEPDLAFVALMAPIVNVEHAIWQSPAAFFMRRELHRAGIDQALVARHFHLSSPGFNQPVVSAERILFIAGDYDLIARPDDIAEIHQKWRGSTMVRVPQGHFGYRMMRETVGRLIAHGL